jgi:hypothetical protein
MSSTPTDAAPEEAPGLAAPDEPLLPFLAGLTGVPPAAEEESAEAAPRDATALSLAERYMPAGSERDGPGRESR